MYGKIKIKGCLKMIYKAIKNEVNGTDGYKIIRIKTLKQVEENDIFMTLEDLEDDMCCCTRVKFKTGDKIITEDGIYKTKVSLFSSVDFILIAS